MATHDMHRVTANAVADRPAETSAGAYSCLHARRCYRADAVLQRAAQAATQARDAVTSKSRLPRTRRG
jgi:hypothetical protein